MAAAAHGTTLSLNLRRKRNGKSEKTARKTKYQISDWVGSAGSKRLKCHVDSSAATQTRPTAGIQSIEKSFVTPSIKTTSSSARPNTGEGFVSGSRSVAMIRSRNGRTAERMGSCAARLPGRTRLSSKWMPPPVSASGLNLRASQTPTAAKNTANTPMR